MFLDIIVLTIVVVIVFAANLMMRHKGYIVPGKTIVRCSKGHLFITTWIEGYSLKAVRLGSLSRYQYCPIGKHWAIVHPVKESALSNDERKLMSHHSKSL